MLLLGLSEPVKTEKGIEGNNAIILTNISANKVPKHSSEKENTLNKIWDI